MAKIIKLFKTKEDNIIERLEEILDMAKKGEFKNFVFAAEMANKEVCTAWASCDLAKRQELLSHQQIDIMMGVIVENFQ